MKYAVAAITALAWTFVNAQVAEWGQCGGQYYTGSTVCAAGSTCVFSNPYYSQCLPGTSSSAPTTTTTTTTTKSTTTTTTTTTTSSKPTTTTPSTTTTKSSTTTTTTSASATTSISCSSNSPPPGLTCTTFSGVNVAGFDFGCGTDGTCNGQNYPPLKSNYGPDGIGQMQHFASNGMNIFRLPIGWQTIVTSLGGPFNTTEMALYDQLVQGCLATGAHCIVDVHNYARWNGNIIGQSNGAVTNAQFATLWSMLATRYAQYSNVIFGVMNEPHDVPDINAWAVTVQAAVTAIRQAGATTQIILLPGNNYTSAQQFVSNGSAAALSTVKNLDGSITNLIYDVHKYLDSDNSGTHTDCVTDNVSSTFQPLAYYLRCNGRMALLSETGGGNVQDCVTDMGSELNFLRANSDVYLGYVGWSAGSFDSTYNLSESPTYANGVWTDTLLVSSVMYQSGCSASHTTTSMSMTSTTTKTSTTTTTTATSTTTPVRTTTTQPIVTTAATTTATTTATINKTTTSAAPSQTAGACTSAVTNPYADGLPIYLSPFYVAEVNAAIAGMTSTTLQAKAAAAAKVPNFTWFDQIAKVPTLSTYLADALSQGTMIVQIVIYDLPNRDCHAKASNGEFSIANNGVANYENYINQISAAISAYPGVRVVAVVEPDSLANLVTNLSDPNCQAAQSAYMTCTTYVLKTLQQCNVFLYLDAGHAGWLGWTSNIGPAATLFTQVYNSAKPNRVRGLATNVANYNALQAATPDPVTQGDPNYDEYLYITALGPMLQQDGFPASFITDMGRSGVQNIRVAWGDWCNIKGAGMGLRPTATGLPTTYLDAIVWVKPGGECDGTSNSSAPRYDSTCSLSDALQPAPQAGAWFEAYFEQLITNAVPAF